MIRVENVSKVFRTQRGDVRAVDDVSFEVPTGELCVLLGPSGCGKTTMMKLVNRLLQRSSGKIFIGEHDTDSYDVVTLRRNIGYVIQQIGLFPNMTVEENIAVVPRLLGWSRSARHDRARELIAMVALDESLLERFPKELSGGQQQRVGVARGLAADPPVLLMDEPFGAVDPINREIIQDEFLKMQGQLKKTILFVSHDIDEAVKMGDKVAIFREGRLVQFDAPDMLLAHPVNDFVADFVGGDRELKRMRLVRVSEALDPRAPTVGADDDVELAARKMQQAGTEFIVVLDEVDKPTGTLLSHEVGGSGLCKNFQHPLPRPLRPRDDLRTAVSRMFTLDTDWLPCTDENGRLSGVVTRRSVTQTLRERSRPSQHGSAQHEPPEHGPAEQT